MAQRFGSSVICLALAASVGGCAVRSAPPTTMMMARPALVASVREYSGSALSGPLAAKPDPRGFARAWGVGVRVVAVGSLPTRGFEPIGPFASLVVNDAAADWIAPSSRLDYAASISAPLTTGADLDASLGAAGGRAELASYQGAVAPGTAIRFEVTRPPGDDAWERRTVAVRISPAKAAGQYELTVTSVDRAPHAGQPDVTETVLLARSFKPPGERFALAVPIDFGAGRGTGVVFEVSIDASPPDPIAIAALRDTVDASAQRVAEALSAPPASADDLAIAAAIDAVLDAGDSARGPLAFLAQQSGAKLSERVILVADETLISLIAKSVRAAIGQLPTRDRATVGWMLDRAVVRTIATLHEEQAARMLPPVQGALESFAGEAGRQVDTLQSLVGESRGCDDLYNHIVAENLIALEDESPAARVRAYDWLRLRSLAPAGYDPLAAADARRSALDAAQTAAAAAKLPH